MIPLIVVILVSGCLCAPSGNTTSSASSSSVSSSSVSSSSTGGNGVTYSVTQKFSSGTPNITTSLSKVSVSQGTLPLGSSISIATNQKIAAMTDKTNQMIAAMQKQNQVQFAAANNMATSIHQAVKASHAAIQNSFQTMFKPFSIFTSSPFFV